MPSGRAGNGGTDGPGIVDDRHQRSTIGEVWGSTLYSTIATGPLLLGAGARHPGCGRPQAVLGSPKLRFDRGGIALINLVARSERRLASRAA
jgi:hypothetical protein